MNLASRFSSVLVLASSVWSQTVTQGPLLLPAADIRVYQAKAGVVASDFVFILDPAVGGQEFLDLRYDDASLVFSLVRPDGVEITQSNAGSLGYIFQTFAPSSFPVYLGPVGLGGNHLQIQLPAGQSGGAYTVKIDATAATANTLVWGVYSSSSDVHVGVAAAVREARVGDVVNFSAIVLDGTLPVTNASVKAQISWDLPLNGQVALSNFVLVSQTPLADGTIRYVYRVTGTNNGAAATLVSATTATSDPTIGFETAGVFFGDSAAGASAQSGATLAFVKRDAIAPNPAGFSWQVVQPAPTLQLDLVDSGPADFAPGDVAYSGAFTAGISGVYPWWCQTFIAPKPWAPPPWRTGRNYFAR